MERPGLLEFAVYAMVLGVAGGWVYGLPPFDYESGERVQFAHIEPTSADPTSAEPTSADPLSDPLSEQPESFIEFSPIDIGPPAVTAPEVATAPEPEQEVRADPPPNLLVVTARSLNMRAQPNARSPVVGTYPIGSRVEQVDVSGNWILVRTEDEATGWMYSAYLGEPYD